MSSLQKLTKTITTAYTVTLADCGYVIICNSASPFAITLPSATGLKNFNLFIANKGSGNVTCDSKTIYPNCMLFLFNDNGTTWVSSVIDNYGNSVVKGNITAGSTKITIAGTPTSSVFGGGVSVDVNEANFRNRQGSIKTANYTLTTSDCNIVCNSVSGFTATLPAATGSFIRFTIKNINAGAIIIDANASETIDGELTQTIYQWECIEIVDYASGKWIVV